MKFLSSLGRFLYAIPFVFFGLGHFAKAKDMAYYLKGWPFAEIFVYVSGLALLLAGVSIIINLKAKLACQLLALLLLIFIVALHIPAHVGGDQMAMVNIMKDLALLGAALTYSGILKK